MIFQHGQETYRFGWTHITDPAEARTWIEQHRPARTPTRHYDGRIPLKPQRITGMTICQVLRKTGQTKPHPKDPTHQIDVWEPIAEGYAFQHYSEQSFDRAMARRISLRDALDRRNSDYPRLDYQLRKAAWTLFNSTWPPISPYMSDWHKKYEKLAAKMRANEAHIDELCRMADKKLADTTLGP